MEKFKKYSLVGLFFIIVVWFFSPYFLKGKPLFPGNLLVSFYSPWKYEQFSGWEQGIPNKPIGFDNLRFFYPIKTEALSQFWERKIPLWNPYNFSGNVILADSQSALLYPLNLLFIFLPFMQAWSLFIILVPLIVGIFTYLFLRAFNLSKTASFLGGFSFAFSGFMVVWMEENPAVSHSAVWLPVVLFGIKKFIDIRQIRFWLLSIFALVFSVLAGFLQISIYLWIFAFIFSLYALKQNSKTLFSILTVFFFSLLISAVHLIPAIEAFLLSPRLTASVAYLSKEYLTPLVHLITLVAPDLFGNPGTYNYFGGGFYYDKILYIGLVPFLFCLYAIFNRVKTGYFFGLAALITLILGFKNPISQLIFILKVPFLSTVTPSRIFYLTAFSVSILAALGFDSWIKNQNGKKLRITIASVFLFFVAAIVFVLRLIQLSIEKVTGQPVFQYRFIIPFDYTLALTASRNLVIPLVILLLTSLILILWLKKKNLGGGLAIAILILTILPQYHFFKKSLYLTDDNRFVFPETQVIKFLKERSGLDRIIGVGEARIFPNFLLPFHLFTADGLDPVFSRRYGEFLNVANGKTYTTDIPRIEARLFFEKQEDFKNSNKLKALSFLGVKYLLVPQKTEDKEPKDYLLPSTQFKKVYNDGRVTIWENSKAYPRCFSVNDYVVNNNDSEILNIMFGSGFDLQKSVVLEEKPAMEIDNKIRPSSTVNITSYSADKIVMKTNVGAETIVLCTENDYPGWKATIDGQDTKIYRADYSFRAVAVPQGSHEVVFSYKPASFKYGVIISLVGLLATGIYGVLLSKKLKED